VLADAVPELRRELERSGDPTRAAAMAAYMQGRFPFLGVPAPVRRRAAAGFVRAGRAADAGDLLAAADALWVVPERELQYVGTDLLRRFVDRLGGDDLPRVERLIRARAWWDTVDALAAHVVGPIVAREPDLVDVMDRWVDDGDVWVARAAILHQLTFGDRTDARRLFDHVDRRCDDTEFFIRKACGWALRQYAHHAPDEVRDYVKSRQDRLSALTRREATKHLA
jgi:3-methyladenine DNA glycosylase AlkD